MKQGECQSQYMIETNGSCSKQKTKTKKSSREVEKWVEKKNICLCQNLVLISISWVLLQILINDNLKRSSYTSISNWCHFFFNSSMIRSLKLKLNFQLEPVCFNPMIWFCNCQLYGFFENEFEVILGKFKCR